MAESVATERPHVSTNKGSSVVKEPLLILDESRDKRIMHGRSELMIRVPNTRA